MTLQKQALNQIEDYNQLRYKEENMKNAINKIINDYKAYQETGIIKVK